MTGSFDAHPMEAMPMNRLNVLLTLSSLNVLLVTIERFSFTTQVILQPYSFLRLHEVFQIATLILFTVLIPTFVLREVTHDFDTLKNRAGMLLLVGFVTGIYFYATGNGIHELASFQYNTFCPTTDGNPSVMCQGMFFNDYYFGNGLYFVGAFLMNTALIVLEGIRPLARASLRDMIITTVNALVYALAIIAYAAFDLVVVGLVFTLISMFTIDLLLWRAKQPIVTRPFTYYAAVAYTIGGILGIALRFGLRR
jgi:hypothetical protein